MTDTPTAQRKSIAHTKVHSHEVLNNIPVAVAEEWYQALVAEATASGSCRFPDVSIANGQHPRLSLSKIRASQIEDPAVRHDVEERLSKKRKVRVAYHQLAWRASGYEVPAFDSGNDLGHKCRRGQMQCEAKTSKNCAEARLGCFAKECLELSQHNHNLSRARCTPIVKCPLCSQFFNQCTHGGPTGATCGATPALTDAINTQKPIARITVEYTDGTSACYEHEPPTTTSTTVQAPKEPRQKRQEKRKRSPSPEY